MTSQSTAPGDDCASGLVRLVLRVFLPFAGGYYLSYLYRSVNAVIAPRLVRDIGLDAADLGLLTSVYFLSFAAFQIPLGILLDRFGPRRVQAALLCVAALGAAVFALGGTREWLMAGRALIGLGVAGGLMASFKAITQWFPRDRWPLVNGCFLAMGGLGAMSATAPVEALLGYTDWRGLFAGLALATVAAAGIILAVVPEPASGTPSRHVAGALDGLKRVYRDRLFWRIAPVAVAGMAAGMSIQGLWAGPWLRDVAGLDPQQVASYLFVLALALTVGFVAGGMVADLLGRVGIGLMPVMGGGLLLFGLTQVVIVFQLHPTGVWPWVLIGLLSNATALAYPELSRHFPPDLTGRANTALNVLVFLGTFATQYAMGAIIDLWPQQGDGGYAPAAYRSAFGVFLALQAVGFLWFLVASRKETEPPEVQLDNKY